MRGANGTAQSQAARSKASGIGLKRGFAALRSRSLNRFLRLRSRSLSEACRRLKPSCLLLQHPLQKLDIVAQTIIGLNS